MTDKITVKIPSPVAGKIEKILINDEMEETTSKLIDKYEKAPKPDKDTMLGNLYEEEPWYIKEERGER